MYRSQDRYPHPTPALITQGHPLQTKTGCLPAHTQCSSLRLMQRLFFHLPEALCQRIHVQQAQRGKVISAVSSQQQHEMVKTDVLQATYNSCKLCGWLLCQQHPNPWAQVHTMTADAHKTLESATCMTLPGGRRWQLMLILPQTITTSNHKPRSYSKAQETVRGR
jgi:hypothetical protein